MISKRNKRGLTFLVVLVGVISFLPRLLTNFQSSNPVELTFEELKEVEQSIYKKQFATTEKKRAEKRKKYVSTQKYKLPPKKFDPNKTSQEDWLYLGLTEKQASVVMSFLKRPVYSPEDLQKIYVIPDKVMKSVLDSAIFPTKPIADFPQEKREWKENKDTKEIFNLNTVTKSQLESLRGIGPFYAGKIIEYREKLGGYAKKEQLMELWKFNQEKLDAIRDRIRVQSSDLVKINVNSADVETLKKHPYINYSVANSIVKMRNQHGKFTNLNELTKSALIDQQLIEKLAPYIQVK